MRVLVCGSRYWDRKETIIAHLTTLHLGEKDLVLEGGARGADSLGKLVAERLCIPVKEYPADWTRYGRAAGPIRNQRMLDEGKPDLVLAFHDDIEHSRGTKNMVEQAKKAGIPVRIITG